MKLDAIIRGGTKDRKIYEREEAHCSWVLMAWEEDGSKAVIVGKDHLNLGTKFQYDHIITKSDGTKTGTGHLRERHAVILCLFQLLMYIDNPPEETELHISTDDEDGKYIHKILSGAEIHLGGWKKDIKELREKLSKFKTITYEFFPKEKIDKMIGSPFEFPEERDERIQKEKRNSRNRY